MPTIFTEVAMTVPRNLNCGTISTSFLLSATALPISLAAFAFIYANSDSFWSVLWMVGVLPTICVAVIVLVVRDAVKSRPRSQIAGSVLLLTPTVLLLIVMFSPRFQMHQLFTFRPVDFYPHFPPHGLAFFQKFSVCTPDASCAANETKTFTLKRVPDGCCSLAVINGDRNAKHRAQGIRLILNGEEINLRSDGLVETASVKLGGENKVTVQLTGTGDAYIYVVIFYTGKKEQLVPAAPSMPG